MQAVERARLRAEPGGPHAGDPAHRHGRPGHRGVRGAHLRRAVLRRRGPRHLARRSTRRPGSSCCRWCTAQRPGRAPRRYLTRQHVDGVLLLSLHDDEPFPVDLDARRTARSSWAAGPSSGPGRSSTSTTWRGPAGRRAPGRDRPPHDRDHRRAPDMAVGPRPAGRLRRGAGRRRPADDADLVVEGDFSEQSGWAGDGGAAGAAARHRRRLRRERPDGDGRAAVLAGARPTRARGRGRDRLRRHDGIGDDRPAAVDGAPAARRAGSRRWPRCWCATSMRRHPRPSTPCCRWS